MPEPIIDILAFSPHPDDAELGCGGALLLAAKSGLSVAIADLTKGEMSSMGSLEQREKEREEAASLLGLRQRFYLGIPDTEISTDARWRAAVIQLIRAVRPRIVLAPYWKDRHPDHVNASILVRDASFYAGVKKIGTGDPSRPRQIIYYSIHQPFTPSFVMDISAVWEAKRRVLAAYKSQFPGDAAASTAIGRPDFLQAVETKARWFGSQIGVAFGEAFLVEGPVGLSMFPELEGDSSNIERLPPYRLY